MSRRTAFNQMNEGSSGMRDPSRNTRQTTSLHQTLPLLIDDITVLVLYGLENTLNWFDSMRNTMGNAAGVDGVQLRHLFRADVARLCRPVIAAIHAGQYGPSRLRQVDIPRPDGRVRTLRLLPLIERIVHGAAASYLTRAVARLVGPIFHGSLPNRGVRTFLKAVERAVLEAPPGQPLFAHEVDVARAFDNVRLNAVTSVLHQMGFRPEVVNTLQQIMTPHGASGEIIGLAQGHPFSPILFTLTMNACLQQNANLSEGVGVLNPLVYVDNVAYISHQEQLIHTSIQMHTTSLGSAGLSYSSQSPPVDLRQQGSQTTVLGNQLTVEDNRVIFRFMPGRLARVTDGIRRLVLAPDPRSEVRNALISYAASTGHVYATAGREYCMEVLTTLLAGSEVTDADQNLILRQWELAGGRWNGEGDRRVVNPEMSPPGNPEWLQWNFDGNP